MRSRPAFSVTSMRPSGRNATDHGVSRPSVTVSTLNACSSLVTTVSACGFANTVFERRAESAFSRMKITSARISCWFIAAPNGGIPDSRRPSRIEVASVASSPPYFHSSSSRLFACPPCSCAPWQAEQRSAKTSATLPLRSACAVASVAHATRPVVTASILVISTVPSRQKPRQDPVPEPGRVAVESQSITAARPRVTRPLMMTRL